MNSPVNGKIQGLFKAFECFSSTFQGIFNFQGLFKTVLYIQVLFKPVWTLQQKSLWQICTCLPEPSLLNNVISSKLSCAGSKCKTIQNKVSYQLLVSWLLKVSALLKSKLPLPFWTLIYIMFQLVVRPNLGHNCLQATKLNTTVGKELIHFCTKNYIHIV